MFYAVSNWSLYFVNVANFFHVGYYCSTWDYHVVHIGVVVCYIFVLCMLLSLVRIETRWVLGFYFFFLLKIMALF